MSLLWSPRRLRNFIDALPRNWAKSRSLLPTKSRATPFEVSAFTSPKTYGLSAPPVSRHAVIHCAVWSLWVDNRSISLVQRVSISLISLIRAPDAVVNDTEAIRGLLLERLRPACRRLDPQCRTHSYKCLVDHVLDTADFCFRKGPPKRQIRLYLADRTTPRRLVTKICERRKSISSFSKYANGIRIRVRASWVPGSTQIEV